jgi:PEP-CTERM motif
MITSGSLAKSGWTGWSPTVLFAFVILLTCSTRLNAGSLDLAQADYVNQLNNGTYLSIRQTDTGGNPTFASSSQPIYSFTYDTSAQPSPWILTALLKAAVVIGGGIDGGLIGDLASDKWGNRGCAIGLGGAGAFITAVDTLVPLAVPHGPASGFFVHDAEIFGSINVQGTGNILPSLTSAASSHIAASASLPGISPTFSISFIDQSVLPGTVIDKNGNPVANVEFNAFILNDSLTNQSWFGYVVSDNLGITKSPITFDDRVNLELGNLVPGVSDGTPITVVSTLSVARDDVVSILGKVPEPSSLVMLGIGVFGLLGFARRRHQR